MDIDKSNREDKIIYEMTIEAIARDLSKHLMTDEKARVLAKEYIGAAYPQALEIKYRMRQAFSILEETGLLNRGK